MLLLVFHGEGPPKKKILSIELAFEWVVNPRCPFTKYMIEITDFFSSERSFHTDNGLKKILECAEKHILAADVP